MSMLLLFSACLKPPEPLRAATPAPVVVAAVVSSYDEPSVTSSEAVVQAVSAELSGHGLAPTGAEASVVATFERVRTTDARLQALGEGAVLLVELAPRYSSQMSGRYRWTVDTRIELVAPGSEPLSRELQVPVHLIYAHQQEAEAAAAAVPVVAREVSEVLDAWISAAAPTPP